MPPFPRYLLDHLPAGCVFYLGRREPYIFSYSSENESCAATSLIASAFLPALPSLRRISVRRRGEIGAAILTVFEQSGTRIATNCHKNDEKTLAARFRFRSVRRRALSRQPHRGIVEVRTIWPPAAASPWMSDAAAE